MKRGNERGGSRANCTGRDLVECDEHTQRESWEEIKTQVEKRQRSGESMLVRVAQKNVRNEMARDPKVPT